MNFAGLFFSIKTFMPSFRSGSEKAARSALRSNRSFLITIDPAAKPSGFRPQMPRLALACSRPAVDLLPSSDGLRRAGKERERNAKGEVTRR